MNASRAALFLAGLALLPPLGGCSRRSSEPARPVPGALTTAARYEGQPDLSPDGRTLVYSAFGETGRDLFTMPARGGAGQLLLAGPGDEQSPRWSPDGTRVVFTSDADGQEDLWIVPAGGGEARRLTVESSRDRQPAWSPDGSSLVFVSDRGGRADLWRLSLSTGAAGPLTSGQPPAADYAVTDPAWDREGILFSATVGGATDLYRVAPEGGAWRRVTDGPARERHPSMSRNGRLAYVSDTTGYFNLYVREPDGRITTVSEERTDVAESCWLDEGREIAFTRVGPWALLVAPLSGAPIDTALAPRGRNAHPTWSPDGTELAFHSDLEGQDDIWRVQVEDGAAGPITSSLADDRNPDWSPANNRIVYESGKSGNPDIWIMDPSGIEYQQLTDDPAADREPRWTPDGRAVIFISERLGQADVWIVPVTGGEPRRLTATPAVESWPAVLADGRTVVFGAELGPGRALWTMPIDGGQPEPLTRPEGAGHWDGQAAPIPGVPGGLVYSTRRGDERTIVRLDAGRGSPEPLAPGGPVHHEHPAVSADGARVAWRSGGNVDIWRVAVPLPASRP